MGGWSKKEGFFKIAGTFSDYQQKICTEIQLVCLLHLLNLLPESKQKDSVKRVSSACNIFGKGTDIPAL